MTSGRKVWIGLAVAVPVSLVALVALSSSGLCGNEEIKRIPSPSGVLEAVVFTRDCGATTRESRQVAILQHGSKLPNESGFFAVEGSFEVAWKNDNELLITYPRKYGTFEDKTEVKGVKIDYVKVPPFKQ